VISVEPLELDWVYDWSWEDEEEEDEYVQTSPPWYTRDWLGGGERRLLRMPYRIIRLSRGSLCSVLYEEWEAL
jgi:hypothetical protein